LWLYTLGAKQRLNEYDFEAVIPQVLDVSGLIVRLQETAEPRADA